MAIQLLVSMAKTDRLPASSMTPASWICRIKPFMMSSTTSGSIAVSATPSTAAAAMPRAQRRAVRRKSVRRKSRSRSSCSVSQLIPSASPGPAAAGAGSPPGPGCGRSLPRRRASPSAPPPRCAPAT